MLMSGIVRVYVGYWLGEKTLEVESQNFLDSVLAVSETVRDSNKNLINILQNINLLRMVEGTLPSPLLINP